MTCYPAFTVGKAEVCLSGDIPPLNVCRYSIASATSRNSKSSPVKSGAQLQQRSRFARVPGHEFGQGTDPVTVIIPGRYPDNLAVHLRKTLRIVMSSQKLFAREASLARSKRGPTRRRHIRNLRRHSFAALS